MFILSCLLLTVQVNKKNPRYLKGLVTSQNIGYLFSFFLRMEGCRKEKKFCQFEQSLVLKQNISMAFDEKKNLVDEARFFPPKDLEFFLINTRHNSK